MTDSGGGITVSYGVHSAMADAVGKTVAEVRTAVKEIMNLPDTAGAVIKGQRVPDSHVLQRGQTLEFIKEAGVKG